MSVSEIRRLRKEEHLDEAWALGQQLPPGDPDVAEALGWVLQSKLKPLIAQARDHSSPELVKKARDLFAQYFKLFKLNSPRPSVLHSTILGYATSIAEHWPNYRSFVKWWDLRNIREDDHVPYDNPSTVETKAHRNVPTSRAEKVALELGKSIEGDPHSEDTGWVLDFLRDIAQKHPENHWVSYRIGKILISLERRCEARAMVIPCVRRNARASWAWHVLGLTFVGSEPQSALACFSKGILESDDEQFIGPLRVDLAKLMIEMSMPSEAKAELETATRFRETMNYRNKAEIRSLLNREDIKAVSAAEDNSVVYARFAPEAAQIIVASLPWQNSLVLLHLRSEDNRPGRALLGLEDQGHIETAVVGYDAQRWLQSMPPGSPVQIKTERDHERLRVLSVERRSGDPWDLIAEETGVVVGINPGKGVATIMLRSRRECLAHFDRFPSAKEFELGQAVALRAHCRPDRDLDDLLTLSHTTQKPDVSLLREFMGHFEPLESRGADEPNGGPGFIRDRSGRGDVYVSRELVQANTLSRYETVRGVAVFQRLRNPRPKDGWRAIKIDPRAPAEVTEH